MRLSEVMPGLAGYINENALKFPANLSRVIIFGSFAKGTARVGSDVDIALVSPETWSFENRSLMREIFENYECGAKLSLFYTTENGLQSDDKNNANFWIRTEGKILWSCEK
ncbi:MAG: nucleotidyltransferase domain-containing protein [Defluviitaleaceae bacterium]|nr:nucleotidyltransferase domain-containing protein [Defluviitaleaceae bacterium]